MPNYHLTDKGEDFLDQFEELGTGQVEADLVAIYGWFAWIRESPGSYQLEVFKGQVGEEKAIKALDWAVRKGYLKEGPPEDVYGTGPYDVQAVSKWWAQTPRGKVREQTYDQISDENRKLARRLAIAKESGDDAEYSRLLDEMTLRSR